VTNSSATNNRAVPTLERALLTGAIGFCIASLVVFATVAFAEGWIYRNHSVAGA
jgi:hypothetical protein